MTQQQIKKALVELNAKLQAYRYQQNTEYHSGIIHREIMETEQQMIYLKNLLK